MKTDRRRFLKTTGLTLGAASFLPAFAAESSAPPSFILRPSKMKLGTTLIDQQYREGSKKAASLQSSDLPPIAYH